MTTWRRPYSSGWSCGRTLPTLFARAVCSSFNYLSSMHTYYSSRFWSYYPFLTEVEPAPVGCVPDKREPGVKNTYALPAINGTRNESENPGSKKNRYAFTPSCKLKSSHRQPQPALSHTWFTRGWKIASAVIQFFEFTWISYLFSKYSLINSSHRYNFKLWYLKIQIFR